MGAPINVVKAKTVDLLVPAEAEIVIEGLIIAALVLTGFRTAVFNAVPEQLKYAIGVGIGLFITIIGLVDSGIVRPGVPLISFGTNGALRVEDRLRPTLFADGVWTADYVRLRFVARKRVAGVE